MNVVGHTEIIFFWVTWWSTVCCNKLHCFHDSYSQQTLNGSSTDAGPIDSHTAFVMCSKYIAVIYMVVWWELKYQTVQGREEYTLLLLILELKINNEKQVL